MVVAGMLFRGMSTRVVTPPAAAARVAVANPSHSVRPGSLMWTCVSTIPGMRTESPQSITGTPDGASSIGPTRSIFPSQDVHRGRPDAFRRHDPLAGEEEIGEHR